ncbi:MAG: hypothetical protein AAGJ31_12530, partial [Verrucomicrobiota bacterium]
MKMHAWLVMVVGVGLLGADIYGDSYEGSASVRFEADSTLHPFGGTLPLVPLQVTLDGDKLSMSAGFLVKEMTNEKKARDKEMVKMFGVPSLGVEVQGASYAAARPQGGKPGTLPVI